jgi:hypothetical protein
VCRSTPRPPLAKRNGREMARAVGLAMIDAYADVERVTQEGGVIR